MALDGIYLYSLVQDLKKSIINSKIDKINQPEKDELVLTLRKERKNTKLLISASPKYARIHITNNTKENPLQAPMFTMVLRKYLIGGKIIELEQIDGDRLLTITIEASDELGFNSLYKLVVEIMGRHSNITLIRCRDNKVMESIKHIGADVNSYRILFPGVTYVYPPQSKRLNPYNIKLDQVNEFINENLVELNESLFSSIFTGISKNLSKSLFGQLVKTNENIDYKTIYQFIVDFIHNLDKISSYKIIKDADGTYKDFTNISDILNDGNINTIDFDDPNELLEKYYVEKDKQERIKNRSFNIQRLLSTNIERCINKGAKLEDLLEKAKSKDTYKLKGDLLTSFIYSFKQGDSEVTLQNFFAEDEEYLTLKLDPNKSPSENVQLYYKKYNKLKKSEENAKEQLDKNSEELDYLYSVLNNLQLCESYTEIEDIKNELISSGYIRKRKQTNGKKREKPSKPLHFVSSDNIDIFIGKNNIQNDHLSFKFAQKNYMWLHAKNVPGSHVIICATDIPDTTLIEAATLAAFYSKSKDSTKVTVDYTLVKNLRKQSSGKPGMVIYHTNYSVVVEPTEVNNLKISKKN